MSLKLGNTNINKVYLGNTEVNKVYLGNTEVFGTISSSLTPSFVTAQSASTDTETVTVTGLTPDVGDYLIAAIGKGNYKDDSVTPAGWTLLHSTSNNFGEHTFYGKVSDGTESSITFNNAGANGASQIMMATVHQFTNVNTTTPYENLQTLPRTQSLAVNIPSVTSTSDNSLAIFILCAISFDTLTYSITVSPTNYVEENTYVTQLASDGLTQCYSSEIGIETIAADSIGFSSSQSPTYSGISLILKP